MDVSQFILQTLGDQGLNKISSQAGMDKSTTANAMSAAIPTLLSAMSGNAKQGGASSLLSALDRDHDGSVLDDLSSFLDNPAQGNGNGILNHVLSDKRPEVETALAAKSGASALNIGKILEIAAPLVMAYLGREKRQNPSSVNESGIADILSNLAGNSRGGSGLDIGDILNVVGGLSGNQGGRSGGIGSLLKGLFGR